MRLHSVRNSRLAFLTATAIVVATPAVVFTSAFAAPGPAGGADGTYIVTFADEPVASYDGYLPGFASTRPQPGHKIDPASPAARAWQQRLTALHDVALSAVGATKIYDYTITNNGFAASLTAEQAARIAKAPGVVAVTRDRREHPVTTLSPSFLGLDAGGGLWSRLGGASNAGAGVVVGVIDTGIWPESDAFAGNTGIPVPAGWQGRCVAGQLFPSTTCNDKLIGARYYLGGFGAGNIAVSEYRSARDGAGHGSHTASTAAGNHGTQVSIDGYTIGTASGMAPGAKISAYKVCWEGRPSFGSGCFSSDSVAAINDAVADGVDVLNYSIGGTTESDVLDPVAQAFRGASNANVFVANSAGNSGPGASTIDHPAPWVTTVAAATFRRAFQAAALGNGARYVGASTTSTLPTQTRIVTAKSVKLAGASDANAALCIAGTLDPAAAAGTVVVCDRGVNARIDKSFEVKRAGGVGMVLANVSPNSLNGDYHAVPSVHVDEIAGDALKAYIAAQGAGATAAIVPLTAAELAAAPQVPEIAAFSSRGPSTTTGGDILKPDIAAPGNDVVAAVAPPTNHGRSWDFYSGTSMSSPHIAGIGALLRAQYPAWLPSEIKSAIMTSARDTVSSANDPFAQGAGFVNPNGAADPGLVYPTSPNEYRQYLVGLGVHFAPPYDTLTPIGGSELNQASIAGGTVAGIRSVTRRVKNVGSASATYSASASVPGFATRITPEVLALGPGQEGTFAVQFTRDTAAFGEWASGFLTWSDGSHQVRSPIAVRPVAVAAPAEVHAAIASSGSIQFSVTPGYTGTLESSVAGLVGVTPISDSVTSGAYDLDDPVADADTKHYAVPVPAGTAIARFSLDGPDGSDLDLFVYLNGDLVAYSATSAPDEQVTLVAPAAGTYDVYVNGYATPRGGASYALANFVVAAADAGNATVTPNPASVTIATPLTLTATWSGLDTTKRWLGAISYTGAGNVTLLSIP
jgi:subtilisin family serine protease